MSDIRNRIHAGRTLTRFTEADGEDVIGWPELAYESIRAINHLTSGAVVPAPVLYQVLGELKGVGHLLPQALNQLGVGLERSLTEIDGVYDDARDPADTVTRARQLLTDAAAAASQLGALLEEAQAVIAAQGYGRTESPSAPAGG